MKSDATDVGANAAPSFSFLDEPAAQMGPIPRDSIVSRTLIARPQLRVVLFGFAPGEELTEHSTPMAATIHILQGEGEVTLDSESLDVSPGDLIYMAPALPHSVRARSELKLLLTMVKRENRGS